MRVAGQHIRVAVHAERLVCGGILRVELSAGGELDDTGAQRVAQHRPGKTRSAIVEQPNDIAVANTSHQCIPRMDANWLPAVDL